MLCFQPLGCKWNPLYPLILHMQTQVPATVGPSEQCHLGLYPSCWYFTGMGKCKSQKDPEIHHVRTTHQGLSYPLWSQDDLLEMKVGLVQPENVACPEKESEAQGKKATCSQSQSLLVFQWSSVFLPSFLSFWSQHFISHWELPFSFIHRTQRSSAIPQSNSGSLGHLPSNEPWLDIHAKGQPPSVIPWLAVLRSHMAVSSLK